ncbi:MULTISPECIES: hypothetical protein [Microcystis]|uniref:Uncharacterized protein n=2 Tax=Microcystis TaxID=1125 RepID=A0A0A1VRX0_MICAE|nr:MULTISPECIES: hypothetical protein [Microcystis]MDT3676140.1 hypothetical protein [Microcystis wesenbergii NRERC-220]GAL92203.1 hypothetical protein N44_00491 [Microcystis aeruginosa NIES-44]
MYDTIPSNALGSAVGCPIFLTSASKLLAKELRSPLIALLS